MATNAPTSGVARFRVSDVVPVPLRGYMLRLRVTEGEPAAALVRPGRSLRLVGPDGGQRVVRIQGIGAPSGRSEPGACTVPGHFHRGARARAGDDSLKRGRDVEARL